jgi:starch synthase
MLSFESTDVVHVGGLGPAVTNLARSLADRFDVSIFMPSHGKHQDPTVRDRLELQEVPGFVCTGSRHGADGNLFPYRIGMDEGGAEGVRYGIFKGLDHVTSIWLDDRQVYDGELTYQKIALFARAIRSYADFVIENEGGDEEEEEDDGGHGRHRVPDIIHAHDWNVIPAAVALKQAFVDRGMNVPLVFTIHLLGYKGFPWHYISEEWCGIKDERQEIHLGGGTVHSTYREVWDNLSAGKIERFGALEADFVTTVSEAYLRSDVLPFVGEEVSKKAGYIYNGCDWDEKKILESVLAENRKMMMRTAAARRPSRSECRRYLLTTALANAGIPEIQEQEIRRLVVGAEAAGLDTPKELEPFQNDGELVIFTGRLDRQKGVDLLLKAVPEVVQVFPSVKFLLMTVPLAQRETIESMVHEAAQFPKNVRLVLGRAPSIFNLAHVSADVYAMPSRWEPFGLTALEAMATGNPVVGTRVGGITETVLDILVHGDKATGILVNPEDHRDLARGLVSLLATMKMARNTRARESRSLIGAIPYDSLRELVTKDPSLGSTIRDNCRERVATRFTPENAARMAVSAYETATALSKERALPLV